MKCHHEALTIPVAAKTTGYTYLVCVSLVMCLACGCELYQHWLTEVCIYIIGEYNTVLKICTWISLSVINVVMCILIHLAMGHKIDHPVIHSWCNKGHGMYYPLCGMEHMNDLLLLTGKSSSCSGGNRFPLSLSVWPFTLSLTPNNCILNVLSVLLNKQFPSLINWVSSEMQDPNSKQHCVQLVNYYFKTDTNTSSLNRTELYVFVCIYLIT